MSSEKRKFRINGFDQINGFYDFIYENQDKGITSHHVSLYLFYLAQNNIHMWVEWFSCPYQVAMQGACIGNKKTFYQKIDDLVEWGLIQYKKGVNEHRSPLIKLEVLNRTSTVPVVVPLLVPLPIPLPTPLRVRVNELITNNIQQITNNIDRFEGFLDSLNEDSIDGLGGTNTDLEDEPVTFPDTEQPNETEIKATKAISGYFGISEINQAKHYMAIARFVRFQLNKGNLEYLRKQCSYYGKLKDKNPSYKHKWSNFIGTPEKKYEDGAWNDENWEQKYKDSIKGDSDGAKSLSYPIKPNTSQKSYTDLINRTKELQGDALPENPKNEERSDLAFRHLHTSVFNRIYKDKEWITSLSELWQVKKLEDIKGHLYEFRLELADKGEYKKTVQEAKTDFVNWVRNGNPVKPTV